MRPERGACAFSVLTGRPMLELPEPLSSRDIGLSRVRDHYRPGPLIFAILLLVLQVPLAAQSLSLQEVVTPSTIIQKDGRPVAFAIHGLVEFQSLAEAFLYIAA